MENYLEAVNAIRREMNRVVIGKQDVIDKVLMAMLSGGHVLLEDIPGVGKTTMALGFARVLGLDFKRVQFTPDVLPSDLVGFGIYDGQSGKMQYQPGAVVCNLFLADEINRTSAKTQSALLEVMEEGKVTVDGVTRILPNPFVVIATQNPIGSIGTNLLPESQMDRFMVRLSMGYPELESEVAILKGNNGRKEIDEMVPVFYGDGFNNMKQMVEGIYIHDAIYNYIALLAKATRQCEDLAIGISPRGSIALCAMVKARAFIMGRGYVLPDDVMSVFVDVTAHRVVLSNRARLEKKNVNVIMEGILKSVKAPKVKA